MAKSSLSAATLERVRKACARADVDIEQLDAAIIERLGLLAETTSTLDDCQRAVELAGRVFAHYEKAGFPFTPIEKSTVKIGSLFSDIGKTGPALATQDQQRLVVEMFSIELVPDDTISVADFFARYFPSDAAQRCQRFVSLGLEPSMKIRQFWNLHSAWTLDIMRTRAVPDEAVAAAATHHLLENINPDSIVAADGSFTRRFGSNSAFDRAEKLVIVLDKYDAVRRRSGRDHAAAIEWLRTLIKNNERFKDDQQFNEVIGAVDAAIGPDPIHSAY